MTEISFMSKQTILLNMVIEHNIPLYYNVNVRAEFLEIQRRIIFTEALLSFEAHTKLATLPITLSKKLSSIRSNQKKREETSRRPLRLSEYDIKEFKYLMLQETTPSGNLWREFCRQYVGDQLLFTWDSIVDNFGLNSLNLRSSSDQDLFISEIPNWEAAVNLMSKEGLSSSDAMIVNMFQSSNFEAILSSDADIGIAVENTKLKNKICILPDKVLKSINHFLI